jgi:hypothetical protein
MFAQSSIIEWFSTFATSPWIREEVSIKILGSISAMQAAEIPV